MKTLTRYIVKNFLISVALCFVVFMSLRIVADLSVNMDEFTKKRQDEETKTLATIAREVGSYYGYRSLVYIRELGPVMIVVAAGFTLARMNHTNELTAMLASGVSLHRVLLPVVLSAVGLNILIALDSEFLIPPAKDQLIRRRDETGGRASVEVPLVSDAMNSSWYSADLRPRTGVAIEPTLIFRDERYAAIGFLAGRQANHDAPRGGWVFTPSAVAGARGVLEHPRIHPIIGGRQETATSTEFARTALSPAKIVRSIQTSAEYAEMPVDWEKVRLIRNLRLADPSRDMVLRAQRVVFPVPGDPSRIVLEDVRMEFFPHRGSPRVVLLAEAARWGPYDEKSPADLGWKLTHGEFVYRSEMTPTDLALRQKSDWLAYMSWRELARLARLPNAVDPGRALLARHARVADFVNGLILLLMAAPFVLSRERNLKTSAGLALLTLVGAMVFIYLCRYVGLPPVLGAWLPVLVFGPVVVLMLDGIKT